MKVENRPTLVKRTKSIISALLKLKEGECIRLTTAAEGRNCSNIYLKLKKFTKKKFRTTVASDGNDLLVWLE